LLKSSKGRELMLKIFVCEDIPQQRDRFAKIVQDTIDIEELDMQIALTTGDPEEVIKFVSNHNNTGIYFLDVDLKANINGIELASEIRKYDSDGFIIFITTHAEMSPLTYKYKVEAMDYIEKDNFWDVKVRIRQCILDANTKYSTKTTEPEKTFRFKSGERLINIEYNKILFFETSSTSRKIMIHGIDRYVEFRGTIKEIEERLDDSFYKCHKSYIINKNNIKEIDFKKRIAYMVNDQQCLISSRLLKGLNIK
jgi:two-component system response regulator AgrA